MQLPHAASEGFGGRPLVALVLAPLSLDPVWSEPGCGRHTQVASSACQGMS